MKCPFCGKLNNKVIDSRLSRESTETRRRRECLECDRRFTTYESVEKVPIMLIKKDGRREEFSKDKVRAGMKSACQKRQISIKVIEEFINELEYDLLEMGEAELPSSIIGEKVMKKLHSLDAVAYVRFASVYREFKDVHDFYSELKVLLKKQ